MSATCRQCEQPDEKGLHTCGVPIVAPRELRVIILDPGFAQLQIRIYDETFDRHTTRSVPYRTSASDLGGTIGRGVAALLAIPMEPRSGPRRAVAGDVL